MVILNPHGLPREGSEAQIGCWIDLRGRLSNPRSDLNRAVDQITGSLEQIGYVLGSGVKVEPRRRRRRVVRQLSPADVDRMVEVYQSGSSVPVVAEQFGVHWSTVLKHLEKRGVQRRGNQRKMTNDQAREALALRNTGRSFVEIAARYGVSTRTLRRELNKL